MRGIGWNYQIKNVTPPKRKNESRVEFLIRQIRELMVGFVVMDACCLFLLKVRYSTDFDEELRNSGNLGWGVWLLCIAVMGVQSYFANSFVYWMLEIFAVGFGFSEPKVCHESCLWGSKNWGLNCYRIGHHYLDQ